MLTEKQKVRAAQRVAKERWKKARIAEIEYGRALRNVGHQVNNILSGFTRMAPPTTVRQVADELEDSLHRYAQLITPWAQRVTQRMQFDVALRDMRAWKALTKSLGRSLARELAEAPVAPAFHRMLVEQVALIRSLPLEAAVQVHQHAIAALTSGDRFETWVAKIMETGRVTEGRARLIARTETARTASVLTQARAEYVGSEAYVWRTAQDEAVRPDHRALEGRVIKWNDPPVAGPKMRYHAGQGPNCRCYAQPLLPF